MYFVMVFVCRNAAAVAYRIEAAEAVTVFFLSNNYCIYFILNALFNRAFN